MDRLSEIFEQIGAVVWGPAMLFFFVGTGIWLTVKTRFLPWRNLGYALKSSLSKAAKNTAGATGDISSYSTLMTTLAATIGTGNIVGVATAMVLGGPGALVWMWISAFLGLSTAFAECLLAVKYRQQNEHGEMSGGPMYTLKHSFANKRLGGFLAFCFALFAVMASFGMGNMTQANSIAVALQESFQISEYLSGVIVTIIALIVIVGGISSIARVAEIVVPFMALFYIAGGLVVILFHVNNLPAAVAQIFSMAFNARAAAGGVGGILTVSVMRSMRWGVSRGVFSNEAGLGSAGITAAAAVTGDPARQGYVSMTGPFFDTIIVCTVTGLAIACSGVLGSTDAAGVPLTGSTLTIAAFSTVYGKLGEWLISIGVVLFAFATILAWEYNGEKAFEFLVKNSKYNIWYRISYSIVCYIGATTALKVVWDFSDIANGLMAVPNLICLLAMGKEIAAEAKRYQQVINQGK